MKISEPIYSFPQTYGNISIDQGGFYVRINYKPHEKRQAENIEKNCKQIFKDFRVTWSIHDKPSDSVHDPEKRFKEIYVTIDLDESLKKVKEALEDCLPGKTGYSIKSKL